jgi:hemolysin III
MDVEMRPRLRGVFHQWAFVVSLGVGVLLVAGTTGAAERVSAAVFATAVATMFGVSALYHRITWQPRA